MYFPDEIFSHIISYLAFDPVVEQQKKYKSIMEDDLKELFLFKRYIDDVDVIYAYWSYYYDTAGNVANYEYPITPL